MTVHEYISQKFSTFGIQLSSADLLDIWSTNDMLTDVDRTSVQIALVKYIPELLLRPNVSEGGVSLSFDREGIRQYYSLKCKELGLEDKLTEKPKIRFL